MIIMNGGVSSKSGYRYQDWCTMYFFLNHYMERRDDLIFLICENSSLDFEIWLKSQLKGYQTRSNNRIPANELNELFKFFLRRVENQSRECFLYLILGKEPKGSLQHLIVKFAGDRGIRTYSRITTNYISTALRGIDLPRLHVRYQYLSKREVGYLVFGLAGKILEKFYGDEEDLPPGVINNFVGRFKDTIDEISSDKDIEKRKMTSEDLESLISRIVSSSGYYKETDSGRKFIKIELPDGDWEVVLRKKPSPLPKKPKVMPGQDYE